MPRRLKSGSFRGKLALFALMLGVVSSVSPQTANAQSAEHRGTELIMLGTSGGPTLQTYRAKPSTALMVDGTTYLFDAGIGTVHQLMKANINPFSVETIFITHLHPDHSLGLVDLLANDFWGITNFNRRDAIYNIYGPTGTSTMVEAAVRFFSVPFSVFAAEDQVGLDGSEDTEEAAKTHYVAHEFSQPGVIYEDDKIKVSAMENTHLVMMPAERQKRFKSYSYRVETPHGVIVLTGDTGPVASQDWAKIGEGADVLVSEVIDLEMITNVLKKRAEASGQSDHELQLSIEHMATEHLAPAEIAKLATTSKAKSVLLYHFVPDKGSDEVVVEGVKAGYDAGPVFGASDLDRYCVNFNGQPLAPCSR